MNILVIAPHPDDETIGCGGTLRLHANEGARIEAVWLTSGELGLKSLPAEQARQIRQEEAIQAGKILGLAATTFLGYPDWQVAEKSQAIQRDLVPILRRLNPDKIYLPHPGDAHPDHQPVYAQVKKAIQRSRIPKPELRAYEVWTPLSRTDYVVNISQIMPHKIKALRAHRSQLRVFDYVSAVRGLNRYRGALTGHCLYAEAFQDLSFHGNHSQ